MVGCVNCVFFFKQKTAYELRISGWSSDVCSSDLEEPRSAAVPGAVAFVRADPRIIVIFDAREDVAAPEGLAGGQRCLLRSRIAIFGNPGLDRALQSLEFGIEDEVHHARNGIRTVRDRKSTSLNYSH